MDLSKLSDDELRALYAKKPEASPDIAKMSDEDLKAAYAAKNPSYAADIAKSGGIGVVNAGVGLAGLPGTITNLLQKGADYVTAPLLDDKAKQARDLIRSKTPDAPGSEQIQKGIEAVTGPFYQPKTIPGEVARTVGEFTPGLFAGPGSLLQKGLTQVAAPALASEVAGQATKNTQAEPYARVAGALLGGAAATRSANAFVPSSVPSVDEIKAAATAGYQHPEVKALQVKPQAASTLSSDIQSNLLKKGIDDVVAPQTTKIIQRLENPRFGPTTTVEDLDGARKALANVAPAEMRAAAIARSEIDNYLGNIPQSDLIAGNAQKANEILKEARANWGSASRAEDVQKALSNAEVNTGAAYSGGNINNATRQSLKPILKSKLNNGFSGYTPEEVEQLRTAVLGTPTGNLMRGIGKMGPNGGLMGSGHLMAAYGSGGATAPASIATAIAKVLGDRSTAKNAEALDELLRSRSPLAQSISPNVLANPKQAAAIAALLSADQSRSINPQVSLVH